MEKISMLKIKEVLRLKYEAKLSGAISKYEDLENKGLEAYDASLQAMKQIMLKNLCLPRTV